MIIEYQRPEKLEEALTLLNRPEPLTLAMGGGTVLAQPEPHLRTPLVQAGEDFAVVDLQALGLDTVSRSGRNLVLGAAVRLQTLLAEPDLPQALRQAIQLEAGANLRQAMTLAGALISADGRSPLATALLALDADLFLQTASGASQQYALGDLLPLRADLLRGKLVTSLSLSLQVKTAYAYTARTPADRPIVCAALAQWPAGRVRLALGGYGALPLLVLDGPEPGGLETAARNAFAYAGDQWASAEYRSAAAAELAQRCFENLN